MTDPVINIRFIVEPPPVVLRHNETLLAVEELTMQFGGLLAVNNVSFNVRAGEITALIGPNGAGKTTVFNCITGFYRPTSGEILTNGMNLATMQGHHIVQKARVARTFQNIRLFAGMTVLENLLVAQHNQVMPNVFRGLLAVFGLGDFRYRERAAIDKAKHWLERVGLIERADEPAGSLPYGAQRRLEIARAMCTEPRLLCLDEPAAGLNPRESDELSALLLSIRDGGCAVLLIEHDMGVVMRISDHVVVLDHGVLIADGTPAEVRANPAVIAAYLGEEDAEDAP
jgi:branched-chain amino acid transport system ATP-binding protein